MSRRRFFVGLAMYDEDRDTDPRRGQDWADIVHFELGQVFCNSECALDVSLAGEEGSAL